MIATVQQESFGAGEAVESTVNLAEKLYLCAEGLSQEWRRRYYSNDSSLTELAQLDGVVESLILETAHSLDELTDLPTSAWGRTQGILRLSCSRASEGLRQEFALLRMVLEQAADSLGAPLAQRKRLRMLLDAAQAQAVAMSGRCFGANPNRLPPRARFSGVVVETQ